jgi:hypothetical protein
MAKTNTAALTWADTGHPTIYEVNARVLLNEVSRLEGKKITFASLPDRVLDDWKQWGFDAVWLMGVWTTGDVSRGIARTHEGLQNEYQKVLPEYTPEEVQGSPYSVVDYAVPKSYGGDEGLRLLRERLAGRGMSLILDFVSNHTARDHPWVDSHPEYYIGGDPGDDERRPDIYFKRRTAGGERVLAYGRDPTFPGWTDTAQLNHMCGPARKAIIAQLKKVASMCDGVRCDMAMLILRDVFVLTWGDRLKVSNCDNVGREFWDEAISKVREEFPSFIFIAEAYWNLEWQLQQQGFNFTYDKVLYDRLLREGAGSVRDHLRAEMDFQRRSVRFAENHDESRAAKAFTSEAWHRAAAVVVSTIPGSVLFHEGQFDGRSVRLPIQLVRRPEEPVSEQTKHFYQRLLSTINNPVFRKGDWVLLSVRPAWHENYTWQNFLVFWWQEKDNGARMVVVNYAPHSGQCYVEVPVERLNGTVIEFKDSMSDATFVRDRGGLVTRGMYFDLPGYGYHLFEVLKSR